MPAPHARDGSADGRWKAHPRSANPQARAEGEAGLDARRDDPAVGRPGSYSIAAAPSTPACTVTTVTAEPRRTSPVVTAGFDLPARLAPHVSLAASGRIYWMRRGELDVLTWPRDNSVEFAAFLALRLTR